MLPDRLDLLIQTAEPVPTWSTPLTDPETALVTLARAALIALVTLYLARRIRHWFERITARTPADASTRLLVGRLLAISVFVIGAVTVLDLVGVPLSALVTFVGVIGLAISLALQDILKNLFAGLYLLFERPFRLGDEVAIKDVRGVVETIGIRTTTLRTDENVEVLIPNMTVFAEVVANRTNFKPKPGQPAVPLPDQAPPAAPDSGPPRQPGPPTGPPRATSGSGT